MISDEEKIQILKTKLRQRNLSISEIYEIVSSHRPTFVPDEVVLLAADQIDDEQYLAKVAMEGYAVRPGLSKAIKKYLVIKINVPTLLEQIVFNAASREVQNAAMQKLAGSDPDIYRRVIFQPSGTWLKLRALESIDDLALIQRFVDQDMSLLDEVYMFKRIKRPANSSLDYHRSHRPSCRVGEITGDRWQGEFLVSVLEVANNRVSQP